MSALPPWLGRPAGSPHPAQCLCGRKPDPSQRGHPSPSCRKHLINFSGDSPCAERATLASIKSLLLLVRASGCWRTAGAISFSDTHIILYCFCFIYEIVLQFAPTYTDGVVEVNVQRLRALRQQRVLTLRELEERSGVAYNTIWHLENGKRGAQPRTIRKLADALGVDPGELVKVEGDDA